MFSKKDFCGEFRNKDGWVGNIYKTGENEFVIYGLDGSNNPFTSAPFKGSDFRKSGTSFCGSSDFIAR